MSAADLACLLEKYLRGTLGTKQNIPSLMYSADGQLGYSKTFETFTEVDAPETTTLQGKSFIQPFGSHQGIEVITLCLGAQILNVTGLEPSWSNPIAVLRWGQGSANFHAEIDVKKGTMVTLAASGLTVNISHADPGLLPVVGAEGLETVQPVPYKVQVDGGIVWGDRASRGVSTRTHPPVGLTADQTSTIRPVPNFAYTVFLFSQVDSAAATEVEFYSDNLGQYVIANEEWAPDTMVDGIKIPCGANFYALHNQAEEPAKVLTAVFGLNL